MSVYFEKCQCLPQRWVIAIMSFFALFNAYTLRVCLSIAITKMVVPHSNASEIVDETCPDYDNIVSKNVTVMSVGTFKWSEYTQGIILSSFYWGYTITQVPGGFLTNKIGAKHTIGFAVLFTAILTIITPVATLWGDSNALIAVRFLIGMCEGVIHPGLSRLLSQWLPPLERSTMSSFVFNGVKLGILVSSIGSGSIMGRSTDNWPYIFYIFGSIGIIWYIFWIFIVYNNPRQHPFITEREKTYLHEEMPSFTHENVPPFPWKYALMSRPVLSLLVVQIATDWSNYTIMSDLPKYMNSVLKLPVHLNGYASSLYNVSAWAFSVIMSWVSDLLIKNEYLSRTNIRKINATIACMGPATFLLLAVYAGCDIITAVTFVTVGLTFAGCFYPGIKCNILDLTSNYSGELMGIINGIGAFAGVLAPYTVGVLTPNQTLSEWKLVFWIVAIVYLVGTINFILFASGDVQSWNDPAYLNDKRKKPQYPEEDVNLLTRKIQKSVT